ncbi:MAG: hypothetical protein JWO19_1623 [Bryobacterales bacterium]|nr:hypothetical protein [Bryobacterales bacterium]
MRLTISLITVLGILLIPTSAQWLNYRTPGIPRTKDGKPNLSAPAPRTSEGKPDFTGIWRIARAPSTTPPPVVPSGTGNGGLKNFLPAGETIPFQPWAEELYKKRVASNGIGLPSEHCLPHGLPGAMMIPIAFQIIQTQAQISVLFEEFNYYRRIFTDGRNLPEVMNPTWFGKDALVVDTIGFNDQTWIDISGYPTRSRSTPRNASRGATSGTWTWWLRLMTRRRIRSRGRRHCISNC